MGWITFMAMAMAAALILAVLTIRGVHVRRSGRLEAAFFRARGNRLVANGYVPGR
jgi:hypothetical protein